MLAAAMPCVELLLQPHPVAVGLRVYFCYCLLFIGNCLSLLVYYYWFVELGQRGVLGFFHLLVAALQRVELLLQLPL